MGWFKRLQDGIKTATANKKEAPEGIWHKCPRCAHTATMKEYRENFNKCPQCDLHGRIGSKDYFRLLFDEGKHEVLFSDVVSKDILKFNDTKAYPDRLIEAAKKTGLTDAISVGVGTVKGRPIVVACMDFTFIGGSMGSVVGERIASLVQREICARTDLLNNRTHPKTWDLLRLTKSPTVRIDIAYLTNLGDATRLGRGDFRDVVAEAIVIAIQRLYLASEDDAKTGTLRISDLRKAGIRR